MIKEFGFSSQARARRKLVKYLLLAGGSLLLVVFLCEVGWTIVGLVDQKWNPGSSIPIGSTIVNYVILGCNGVNFTFLFINQWVSRNDRLILSPEGVSWKKHGQIINTSWGNIDAIKSSWVGIYVFVLRQPPEIEATGWEGRLSKWLIPRQRNIPFSEYVDWPNADLVEILAEYAPHLLNKSGG